MPNSDLPPEEHEKILDNDDAMRFASDAAIARAMARGMTRSEAEHIYGFDPEPVLTTEEMNGILLEIMRGEKPDKPELPRRAKFRRELAEEVAEMKKAGIVPETVRE